MGQSASTPVGSSRSAPDDHARPEPTMLDFGLPDSAMTNSGLSSSDPASSDARAPRTTNTAAVPLSTVTPPARLQMDSITEDTPLLGHRRRRPTDSSDEATADRHATSSDYAVARGFDAPSLSSSFDPASSSTPGRPKRRHRAGDSIRRFASSVMSRGSPEPSPATAPSSLSNLAVTAAAAAPLATSTSSYPPSTTTAPPPPPSPSLMDLSSHSHFSSLPEYQRPPSTSSLSSRARRFSRFFNRSGQSLATDPVDSATSTSRYTPRNYSPWPPQRSATETSSVSSVSSESTNIDLSAPSDYRYRRRDAPVVSPPRQIPRDIFSNPRTVPHPNRSRMGGGLPAPGDISFEGQTALLARLLAIAASVTAGSLVGPHNHSSGRAYGSSGGSRGASEGDNSFDGFLSGLNHGLLESELANSRRAAADSESGTRRNPSFFRMFRFPPVADHSGGTSSLIPVLIVGVRAVDNNDDGEDNSGSESVHAGISLLDALSSGAGVRRRPPRRGDEFSNDSFDEESRDTSTAASSADSFFNQLFDEPEDSLGGSSRTSVHSGHSERTERTERTGRPEGPERTGTDSEPRQETRSDYTRQSWIVYVIGGSYPSNHPILLAPSLFTDSPSYEDLMTLESFLGEVKPPVATKDDILSSGGLFRIGSGDELASQVSLDDRCLICLSNYEMDEECRKLSKCSHTFHRECIDQWLLTGRNSCPLCRSEGVGSGHDHAEAPGPDAQAVH